MVGDKTDLHEEDKGGENEGIEAEGRETEGEELKTKKMSVEKSARETVNEQCREKENDAPNTRCVVTIALTTIMAFPRSYQDRPMNIEIRKKQAVRHDMTTRLNARILFIRSKSLNQMMLSWWPSLPKNEQSTIP